MPKYRVLSLKPHLRLDWRGQDSQDETQKPDHSTSGTHRVPVAIGENVRAKQNSPPPSSGVLATGLFAVWRSPAGMLRSFISRVVHQLGVCHRSSSRYVSLAPKATEALRCSEMTRWARKRHSGAVHSDCRDKNHWRVFAPPTSYGVERNRGANQCE